MTKYKPKFVPFLLVALATHTYAAQADPGAWRTAYVQRGWVGTWNAQGKLGPFQYRSEVPIPYAGTKIRVYVQGMAGGSSILSSVSIIKGVDLNGNVAGPSYPVTFAGNPGVQPADHATAIGAADLPVEPGVWYLQETFSSPKAAYAYDIDGSFWNDNGAPGDAVRTAHPGARYTLVSRIDVWTTDTRPMIACYGDSITRGYDSTPLAGKRYPTLLGQILGVPTLNYGVNGDLAGRGQYEGPGMIGSLAGVSDVIFLMGVNDILSGSIKSLDQYQACAERAIKQFHAESLKVYWGTISPFKGCKAANLAGAATLDPAKEALRKQIDDWIRTSCGADGVIDFDKALADPADPERLNPAYETDWLHPNDAGYAKMAEAAAMTLKTSMPVSKDR